MTCQYAGNVSTSIPEDELLLVPEVYRHMDLLGMLRPPLSDCLQQLCWELSTVPAFLHWHDYEYNTMPHVVRAGLELTY